MTADEMAKMVKSNPKLQGIGLVDAMPRYNQVIVSGLGGTPDWREAKTELESMGFTMSPNSGRWDGPPPARRSLKEAYQAMSPEAQGEADKVWDKMVRG